MLTQRFWRILRPLRNTGDVKSDFSCFCWEVSVISIVLYLKARLIQCFWSGYTTTAHLLFGPRCQTQMLQPRGTQQWWAVNVLFLLHQAALCQIRCHRPSAAGWRAGWALYRVHWLIWWKYYYLPILETDRICTVCANLNGCGEHKSGD